MDWIFPSQYLHDTASREEGITFELEQAYRSKTTWFIEEFGDDLQLHRLVVSTAQVLTQRFYVYQSFKTHDRYIVALASLFLAMKVEEAITKFRNIRNIIRAYAAYRRKSNPSFDADLMDVENRVLTTEQIMLKTLCFDVQVNHPYTDAFKKTKSLKSYIRDDTWKEFLKVVANIIKYSYRTTLCLQHDSEKIGLGAIFLATLMLTSTPLTVNGKELTWYEVLETDIDETLLKDLCEKLLKAYEEATATSSTNTSAASVIDQEKIQLARSKLQQMLPSNYSLNHIYDGNISPMILTSASPNTITYPPSVTYMGHMIDAEDSQVVEEKVVDKASSSSLFYSHKEGSAQTSQSSDDDDEIVPPPPPPPVPSSADSLSTKIITDSSVKMIPKRPLINIIRSQDITTTTNSSNRSSSSGMTITKRSAGSFDITERLQQDYHSNKHRKLNNDDTDYNQHVAMTSPDQSPPPPPPPAQSPPTYSYNNKMHLVSEISQSTTMADSLYEYNQECSSSSSSSIVDSPMIPPPPPPPLPLPLDSSPTVSVN